MEHFSYVNDEVFLKKLDLDRNKIFYVEIVVLDKNEMPIQSIQGKVSQGTININGDSSVRRTCQLTFLIENRDTAYTNINYLLAINKKVRISIGIANNIDDTYGKIIGFKQGIFVISQISLSHSSTGVVVNMSCKDKMCLLNGECGGTLPTSVTFDSYDQVISHKAIESEEYLPNPAREQVSEYIIYKYSEEYTSPKTGSTITRTVYRQYSQDTYNALAEGADYKEAYKKYTTAPYSDGETITVPQRIYDIIQSLVINYGGESASNIIINDVVLKIKQLVRWTGSGKLYYNSQNKVYSTDVSDTTDIPGIWRTFNYNEDIGYEWTDFTYPGELVSSIGDNVCSILDKIKETLGNYEYFYDTEGHFIFQEIPNYLNTSYNGTEASSTRVVSYTIDDVVKQDITAIDDIAVYVTEDEVTEKQLLNEIALIGTTNYKVSFVDNSKSVYVFDEGNGLVSSYSNSPSYTNIKNDYHIWGKNEDEAVIHYHLMLKEIPEPSGSKILTIMDADSEDNDITQEMNIYCEEPRYVRYYEDDEHEDGQLYLISEDEYNNLKAEDKTKRLVDEYYTTDWRAELYMQALEETRMQQRPNIYKQELLDWFDDIYNFRAHSFRADIVTNPNELTYWFDFLEPIDELAEYSVDNIGIRSDVKQEDNVIRLFDVEAPDIILINVAADAQTRADEVLRTKDAGLGYTNVSNDIYENVVVGTVGYSAQEYIRSELYQHISYNNSITLQCIPIYHLEVNNRITVRDVVSDIYGDYIIKSISLPLDARSSMSITASMANERV